MVQTVGSHLGLLFAISRVGKGSPRAAWPMGWCWAIPGLPNCCYVPPREDLPLQNPQVCPAGRLWGSFLPQLTPSGSFMGVAEVGGSALEWSGLEKMEIGAVILLIFLAPRSEKWGTSGILRWQTQSIFTAVSLCLQLTLGSCAFPGYKAGNQAVGMLLGLHVTVCTLLMPNLSGLWIY